MMRNHIVISEVVEGSEMSPPPRTATLRIKPQIHEPLGDKRYPNHPILLLLPKVHPSDNAAHVFIGLLLYFHGRHSDVCSFPCGMFIVLIALLFWSPYHYVLPVEEHLLRL